MNSNHSFKLLITLLVLVVAAAGVTGAVSITGDAPNEAEVGSEVTENYTISQPFQPRSSWTLQGTTELANATWTVREIDTAGVVVERSTYPTKDDPTPKQFEHELSQGEDVNKVTVELSGNVPPISNYTFDPKEQLLVASLNQVTTSDNEQLAQFQTHPYDEDSKEAREALNSAQSAIDEVGGHDGAENDLENAIQFYNNGQFESAIENADRAESKASDAKQRSDLIQLGILAGGVIVLLTLVVGGFYWYRSKQTESKL